MKPLAISEQDEAEDELHAFKCEIAAFRAEVAKFRAEVARVQTRMWRTNLIDVEGKEEQEAHALLKLCQSTHNGHWKRNYTIT